MRICRHAYNTHVRAHTCTCTYAHTHTHAHRDLGRPPGNQHPPEAAACTEIRRWGQRDGEAQEPQGDGLAVESVPPTAEPQASLERRADVNELAGHETGRRGDPSCAAMRGGERSGCPLEGGEAWGGRDSGHAAVPESDPCLAAGAQEMLRKQEGVSSRVARRGGQPAPGTRVRRVGRVRPQEAPSPPARVVPPSGSIRSLCRPDLGDLHYPCSKRINEVDVAVVRGSFETAVSNTGAAGPGGAARRKPRRVHFWGQGPGDEKQP